MPQREQLADRLRAISVEMINLGVEMEYYGGLSEIAQHGKEMIGAGHLAAEWARGITAVTENCSATVPATTEEY